MLKAIRYTLAAICLTASVGCLALWWRGAKHSDLLVGPSFGQPRRVLYLGNACGSSSVGTMPETNAHPSGAWSHRELPLTDRDIALRDRWSQQLGRFRLSFEYEDVTFPTWFPALVLALAAVAAIRIGRQFTLRSALVGMSVVAALLGIVVSL